MKTVGILVKKFLEYSKESKALFEHRSVFFMNLGIEIIVVSMNDFDHNKGCFLRSKKLIEGKFMIVTENVMPKITWVQTSKDRERYLQLLGLNTYLYPSSTVISIANDKWNTYRYFKELQPYTKLLGDLNNKDEIHFGDEVVVKPRSGYGGVGVEKLIFEDALVKSKLSNAKEFVVQELCDFSKGFTGICEENHDIRLVYIGGILKYSELRTNEGDFRINVSQGGSSSSLQLKDIPKDLISISENCIERLGGLQTGVCALDFGYDSGREKWILMEPNYSPGFLSSELKSNLDSITLAYQSHAEEFNRIFLTLD